MAHDKRLSTAAKGDFRAATGLKIAAVGVMLVWLAYQWGFGNDATLPTLVANMALWLDDGETTGAAIAAVSGGFAVGFLFTLLTQTIDVLIVIFGFSQLPRTQAFISRYVREKGWVKPFAEMTWVGRWMLAYGVGSSTVLLVDRFARGVTAAPDQRRIATISIALSSISIGIVSGFVVAIAATTLRFPSTQPAGEVIIRIASNPFVWIGLFGGVFLINHFHNRNDEQSEPIENA